MYKYRIINPEQAVEKWSAVLQESTKVTDPEKLNWMSRLAAVKYAIDGPINESEKNLMESYGISSPETTTGMGPSTWPSDPGIGAGAAQGAWHTAAYKNGSGDIPTLIMGLAMNVAAYTVGFDLVTPVPVDLPTAGFQFLDAVYGGGDLDSKAAPQYLALSAAELTGSVIDAQTYGAYIFISKAAAADGAAVRGRFVGKSQFTGELLFKFESCGTIATKVFTADTVGSEQTINDVLTAIGASGAIVPGSTATAVDGTAVALTSPKINFVSSIREHIRAASNNDGITASPMTRAQLEAGSGNKIQLRLWSKSTEMRAEEITADLTRVQLRDLKAYGIDGVAMLYKAAQNQLIQSINDEIVDRISSLGVLNHVQLLNSQNLNLHLYVAPAASANLALTSFGAKTFVDPTGADRRAAFGNILNSETNSSAENLYSRQRRLYSRILAGAAVIGNVSRYGEADVAVVNTQISAALRDCTGFVIAPSANTIGSTSDLHFIGTAGNVKVYVNPKWRWDDTRIVLARRGGQDDPGVKFLAYDLASSVEIISPDTMAPKIAVSSRFDLIDAGFFPEASYLTILCANGFGTWI